MEAIKEISGVCFLMQILDKLSMEGAVLHMLLASMEELVGDVKVAGSQRSCSLRS